MASHVYLFQLYTFSYLYSLRYFKVTFRHHYFILNFSAYISNRLRLKKKKSKHFTIITPSENDNSFISYRPMHSHVQISPDASKVAFYHRICTNWDPDELHMLYLVCMSLPVLLICNCPISPPPFPSCHVCGVRQAIRPTELPIFWVPLHPHSAS